MAEIEIADGTRVSASEYNKSSSERRTPWPHGGNLQHRIKHLDFDALWHELGAPFENASYLRIANHIKGNSTPPRTMVQGRRTDITACFQQAIRRFHPPLSV